MFDQVGRECYRRFTMITRVGQKTQYKISSLIFYEPCDKKVESPFHGFFFFTPTPILASPEQPKSESAFITNKTEQISIP